MNTTSAKHTPGPWAVVIRALWVPWEGAIAVNDKESTICWLPTGYHKKNGIFNAHLIAAAPELLAAAKLVMDSAQATSPEQTEAYTATRAAIDKAEGRT